MYRAPTPTPPLACPGASVVGVGMSAQVTRLPYTGWYPSPTHRFIRRNTSSKSRALGCAMGSNCTAMSATYRPASVGVGRGQCTGVAASTSIAAPSNASLSGFLGRIEFEPVRKKTTSMHLPYEIKEKKLTRDRRVRYRVPLTALHQRVLRPRVTHGRAHRPVVPHRRLSFHRFEFRSFGKVRVVRDVEG